MHRSKSILGILLSILLKVHLIVARVLVALALLDQYVIRIQIVIVLRVLQLDVIVVVNYVVLLHRFIIFIVVVGAFTASDVFAVRVLTLYLVCRLSKLGIIYDIARASIIVVQSDSVVRRFLFLRLLLNIIAY